MIQFITLNKLIISTPIPADLDIAIVKNKENVGKIYLLKDSNNNLKKLSYPFEAMVFGEHYYGYIAIDKDLNTIRGLEFYEHKETPGLGAEVDNPKWKALWDGKKIYKDGKVTIKVIKGKVDQSNKMARLSSRWFVWCNLDKPRCDQYAWLSGLVKVAIKRP